jgi:hypothetical protein
MRILLAALVVALALMCLDARAERLEHQFAKACDLSGTPSSIVVDVYDDLSGANPTPILHTVPNGNITRLGTTQCYRFDLSTESGIGWPAKGDPTEHHYTLVWSDDATNIVQATESVGGTVGPPPVSFLCARETPIYPTVPVPGAGITSSVIAKGNPRAVKVDIDCTLGFSPPKYTFYYVLGYDSQGRVSSRTPSLTAPSP